MRVLLDTNIIISNLRSSRPATSATGVLVRAGLEGGYTLLFVEDVVEELADKLRERVDLAARILLVDAQKLVAALRAVGEPISRLPEPYPQVGRDRKDDFLVAHAVLAAADYLVSWDKDLLELGEVEGVKIVSPPQFLQVLRGTGRLSSAFEIATRPDNAGSQSSRR